MEGKKGANGLSRCLAMLLTAAMLYNGSPVKTTLEKLIVNIF